MQAKINEAYPIIVKLWIGKHQPIKEMTIGRASNAQNRMEKTCFGCLV